jgi:hypothetical protein
MFDIMDKTRIKKGPFVFLRRGDKARALLKSSVWLFLNEVLWNHRLWKN